MAMARYLRDGPCVYHAADLRIDTGRRSVSRGGLEIQLPKLSFDLLLTLLEAAPNVVTTEAFMDRVWPGLVVGPETVVQRVKLLRDALGDDPRSPTYLAGVRGMGYRLIPPVSRATPDSPDGAAPVIASPNIAAESVASVVEPAEAGPEVAESRAAAPKPRGSLFIAAAALIVLAGVSVAAWVYLKSPRPAVIKQGADVAVNGAPIRTVAVMPFEDLSIGHDSGQLALALPVMVLQRLGMVNDLIVIARSSSFAFIGKNLDAREIGARLDARYLVEGALQRVGDRLRINAQLVDAKSGQQLKSLEFDRSVSDIFALQDEIAGQLAAALQVQLLSADMKRVDRSRNTSLEAYLSYLDSQALMNRWIFKDVEKAATELRHAIELDPNFALAYAELARANSLAFFLRYGFQKNKKIPELVALVNKALQLDPQLGEAYAIRGSLEFDDDPAAGDADFRKGILLAPNYGPAYEMYAEALGDTHREDEGLAILEHAILIDPVAPRNIYYKGVYLHDNDEVAAEQAFKRALELGPEFPPSFVRLATNRWVDGQTAEAIKLIERALRVETQSTYVNGHAVGMYLDIGDRKAAGSVAANAPDDIDIKTMLNVYDRHFDRVLRYDITYKFALNTPEYAYWVAMERRSLKDPVAAAVMDDARRLLKFEIPGAGYSLPPDADWGPVLGLAYWLKLSGEGAACANLAAAYEKVLDPQDPEHAYAVADLLKGDERGAMARLSKDVRKVHWNMFWVLQLDPLYDTLRAKPEFSKLIELDDSRMAEQRTILEKMRAVGDVPRR
jgi:TolB-like protein/DNA-binding winged helix-turn-helix (wHTH) protein/Tfp pilus assembly protein PilF